MKILLVDDHSIVRQSLEYIIKSEFPSAICTSAQNGDACTEWLKKESFDLVIMDMNLPDTDGITLTEWIIDRYPEQKILFFSTSPTAVYAKRLYQMGIMGYLNKQASIQEIGKALQTVLVQKKQYLDDEFRGILAEDFLTKSPSNPIEKLSKRELSIAQLLANGKNFDEIATQLSIESSTIRTYKARIYQKLQVNTLHEFLAKAKLYKLI
ncbi:MAG TPA: response regulator transcription factor [Chitinophagaceae bacterium]|jgi:DNA-binding NarL/FixJ family response regulator|nr:response regulator transcription factor [Chitinophagaceae bacterium]